MKHDRIKIKAACFKFLTAQGWPDIPHPDEFVMKNLSPMFEMLLTEKLVEEQDWAMFYLAAQGQYMKHVGGV
jgi:hypothetical protein